MSEITRSHSEEESFMDVPFEEPTKMVEEYRSLQTAILLATHAHKDQVDESGHTYILHPIRVMTRFQHPDLMMTGILHDVLEDTPVTDKDLLNEGIPELVVDAVRLLTKLPGMDYDKYILDLRNNNIARQVKIADIEDNASFYRNHSKPIGYDEFHLKRVARYRRCWNLLNFHEEPT